MRNITTLLIFSPVAIYIQGEIWPHQPPASTSSFLLHPSR